MDGPKTDHGFDVAATEPAEVSDLLQITPPSTADPVASVAERPELVVALVAALGTNVDPVVDALSLAFNQVNYECRNIRISQMLETAHEKSTVDVPKAGSRSRWLMDLGDRLRKDLDLASAAAALAVVGIRARRRTDQEGAPDHERAGVVTIIRSIKREDELRLLRSTYGSRLLVVGISANEDQRRTSLLTRLKSDDPNRGAGWYADEAETLLLRDEAGSGTASDEKKYGQQVRKAFQNSDAYVWLRPGRSPQSAVSRLVNAWFGEPFTTPTLDEQAIFHAFAAKFRSAAAGRQVGVALVDHDGEVLVTGTNDVPKPGGGQYWPGDEPDHRDFSLQFEMNDRLKLEVTIDVLTKLQNAAWLDSTKVGQAPLDVIAEKLLGAGGVLEDSRIADLLEFGRIMHAEMAAICTAARRGTSVGGSTLFTTTYPCHECARLIIGAGIRRVVFIDPYPKSQVKVMYGNQVTSDADSSDSTKVMFVPFEGVAPRLFGDVFLMYKRERATDGTFRTWSPSPLAARSTDGAPSLAIETGALKKFRERFAGSEWNQTST